VDFQATMADELPKQLPAERIIVRQTPYEIKVS